MRLFFTLLLLSPFISWSQNQTIGSHLTGKVQCLNVPAADTSRFRFGTRCLSSKPPKDPLLVVDGHVRKLKTLRELNPNDIERIEIVKGSTATAIYGRDGSAGVILITMKRCQFKVKDDLDGRSIPGATVTFTSGRDTIMVSADDNGAIDPNILKSRKRYDVKITAVGYERFTTNIKGKPIQETEFRLNRKEEINDTVVVSAFGIRRKCKTVCREYRSELRCLVSGLDVTTGPDQKEATELRVPHKLYPNPVTRGQAFTIEFDFEKYSVNELRVIDLSGRAVFVQAGALKGNAQWMVNTDSRWSAGIYIVQLFAGQGRLVKQEKLLIQ